MAVLKNTNINDTGYIKFPSGTQAQRPSNPNTGYIRFNTDSSSFEVYSGTKWENLNFVESLPVPTDGLIMYLDAGVNTSYSGTGTVWNDLSGNGNNASIIGSNTWTSADGGKFDFRGTDQITNYISLPASVLQNYGDTFTKVFWMQPQSNGSRYFDSVSGTSFGDNTSIMQVTNNTIISYLGGSAVSFTNNEFIQITLSRPNSNSGTLRKNLNSTVPATLNSLTAANSGGWILNQEQDATGGGFSSTQNTYAAFGAVLFYNKVLTTEEVTQIYNYFNNR